MKIGLEIYMVRRLYCLIVVELWLGYECMYMLSIEKINWLRFFLEYNSYGKFIFGVDF